MEDKEQEAAYYYPIPADQPPPDWFTKLLLLQADFIYNSFHFLFSPLFSLLSLASHSYRRAEKTTSSLETVVQKVPSKITHGSTVVLRKLCFGLVGAVQVAGILTAMMVLSVVVGVGLVQLWVEEPVFVRERLFFDYTDVNPKAVFSFSGGSSGGFGGGFDGMSKKGRQMGIPVGHIVHVSLVLLMPESDFNRDIVGVFQLTAELLSAHGNVISKSSQPWMLRFRSLPVRLARTFLMGIPLLLGISDETQKFTIDILKHKEGYPRARAIRVTLIPRAGTSSPPQLYEAEILINSQLPWTKALVRNWKWTFYVWTSLYVFFVFLISVICCFRPLVVPTMTASFDYGTERDLMITEESKEPETRDEDAKEGSELLRKWRRSRGKRKAILSHRAMPETGESSASSISLIREEYPSGVVVEEEIGDSESGCYDG